MLSRFCVVVYYIYIYGYMLPSSGPRVQFQSIRSNLLSRYFDVTPRSDFEEPHELEIGYFICWEIQCILINVSFLFINYIILQYNFNHLIRPTVFSWFTHLAILSYEGNIPMVIFTFVSFFCFISHCIVFHYLNISDADISGWKSQK